jgi:zinc protease
VHPISHRGNSWPRVCLKTISSLIAMILLGGSLFVSEANTAIAEELKSIHEIEGISEYKLANGTRILLVPDESKSTVTVNMTVFVGSRHEGYGEAGMAHLLEHMLFKGTPTHPEVPKLLQERGADFNGTTWLDRTNYYETLPANSDNLEFAIRLEADRLINSFIRGEDLASEMTVVRNEFERGENSPIRILMQRITATAYEWHNYGRSTIGNRSDIERVPVVNLRRFYRKFYRPDNVMVIVAGQFEPNEALSLIEKHFAGLTNPDEPLDRTYTTEPAQDGERTVALRRVGDVQFVGAAYHVPAGSHPDFAAMDMLTYILGDEPSGRLYQSMVEKQKLASRIYAFAYALHDPGLLMTMAQVPADHSIEDARQLLLSEMEEQIRANPIKDEEVERSRQQVLKERDLEADDTARLAVSLSEWAAQGDWRLYFLNRDRVEAMTAADIQAAAERYLIRNNRTVGLFIPSEESQRATIPEAPNLKELLADYKGRGEVERGESFDVAPLAVESRTERGQLIGGMRYALVPKKTRGGSVAMSMTIRYGNLESLKGKDTACEILPDLMEHGTESLTYQQLQDELARLRSSLDLSGMAGIVQVTINTKRENLSDVIRLAIDVLRRPRLEASELEVLKRQMITNYESQLSEPTALAAQFVRRQLSPYPSDDPRYVPTMEEAIQRFKSLKIEEIKEVHQTLLSNQSGEFSLVGDFDADAVKKQLSEGLANWTSKILYQRIDRPAHPKVAAELKQIETPDKANAFFYSSQQYSINDAHPDYAALVMGDYVLGAGALSSRLGDRIRQKEGLSYGVRSSLTSSGRDERTQMTIYAITNPGNKDKLLAVLREELDRLLADGITEEELARAKEGFLQNEAVQRTKDDALASQLVGTIFNNRTMKYQADLEANIAALKVQQVNEALRKYLKPDAFVAAIAGDFAKAKAEATEPAATPAK